ncbi:hypothetical protein QBC33DRAFT_520213 [Phialemonium atrogriseum]|uniref:Uncharacterized protein n=1 Tax=Phialemonium atrogriseum TaxID=1093897 RepID=A0AAJ0BPH8_9PEZI|nr:uncharacterized protein QBC33DRAFT_520213 [Phialemonium atrogriseum]KAK1761702.1 hypothetical protein QBC33DRAFT_520213 [Phialemonium atrogriseum]
MRHNRSSATVPGPPPKSRDRRVTGPPKSRGPPKARGPPKFKIKAPPKSRDRQNRTHALQSATRRNTRPKSGPKIGALSSCSGNNDLRRKVLGLHTGLRKTVPRSTHQSPPPPKPTKLSRSSLKRAVSLFATISTAPDLTEFLPHVDHIDRVSSTIHSDPLRGAVDLAHASADQLRASKPALRRLLGALARNRLYIDWQHVWRAIVLVPTPGSVQRLYLKRWWKCEPRVTSDRDGELDLADEIVLSTSVREATTRCLDSTPLTAAEQEDFLQLIRSPYPGVGLLVNALEDLIQTRILEDKMGGAAATLGEVRPVLVTACATHTYCRSKRWEALLEQVTLPSALEVLQLHRQRQEKADDAVGAGDTSSDTLVAGGNADATAAKAVWDQEDLLALLDLHVLRAGKSIRTKEPQQRDEAIDVWVAAVHTYGAVLGDVLADEALKRAFDFAMAATGSDRSALLLEQLKTPLDDDQLQYAISPLYSAQGKSGQSRSRASEVSKTQKWGHLKTASIRSALLQVLQAQSPPGPGPSLAYFPERVRVSEAHRVITSESSFETQCLWSTLMAPINDILRLLGKDISIHSHHPIQKTRPGDSRKTPDWLVLRGTADELNDARLRTANEDPFAAGSTIRDHILLVGETKVHDNRIAGRGGLIAPHTQGCRLDNVGQVQEYADIARVRFGFLVTNQELVLLQFCADSQDHHPHGMTASSPASSAVLASPDRLALQQTPTGTPRVRGLIREHEQTPVVPQSSPLTAIQAARQMADVEQDRRELRRTRGAVWGAGSRMAVTPEPGPLPAASGTPGTDDGTHAAPTVQQHSIRDNDDETYDDHDTEATFTFHPPYVSSIPYKASLSSNMPAPAAALLYLILMADKCKDDEVLKPQPIAIPLSYKAHAAVGRDRLSWFSARPNLAVVDAVVHKLFRWRLIPQRADNDDEFGGVKIVKNMIIMANAGCWRATNLPSQNWSLLSHLPT